MIFVDYLQLCDMTTGQSNRNREQKVAQATRKAKMLAKELNVPVVLLSQLNRLAEGHIDRRPELSQLRESGAIEQDADVVMFLYRDDYYNKDSEMKDMAEVIIAKQRNGPIGTVNLVWMPQYTKFANATRPGQGPQS